MTNPLDITPDHLKALYEDWINEVEVNSSAKRFGQYVVECLIPKGQACASLYFAPTGEALELLIAHIKGEEPLLVYPTAILYEGM